MLLGEFPTHLRLERLPGKVERDRHPELPARLHPQRLVRLNELGLVLSGIAFRLERLPVRGKAAPAIGQVCVPIQPRPMRSVDHPVHRRPSKLGHLRRLVGHREVREFAPHELDRDPQHVVPALAGIEPMPIGGFDPTRPFKGVAPSLGGPFGQCASRGLDPDAAAEIVVTRWVHPDELRQKTPGTGLLPGRLRRGHSPSLRPVERARLLLRWPLTNGRLKRARGLEPEAVAHRANRRMRLGARLNQDLDEGERGHGHARARVEKRMAAMGRAPARAGAASPSEARARRALAPGVGEPEATQHVSCQLIIQTEWRTAQLMSTPVESPLVRMGTKSVARCRPRRLSARAITSTPARCPAIRSTRR